MSLYELVREIDTTNPLRGGFTSQEYTETPRVFWGRTSREATTRNEAIAYAQSPWAKTEDTLHLSIWVRVGQGRRMVWRWDAPLD